MLRKISIVSLILLGLLGLYKADSYTSAEVSSRASVVISCHKDALISIPLLDNTIPNNVHADEPLGVSITNNMGNTIYLEEPTVEQNSIQPGNSILVPLPIGSETSVVQQFFRFSWEGGRAEILADIPINIVEPELDVAPPPVETPATELDTTTIEADTKPLPNMGGEIIPSPLPNEDDHNRGD